jgi:hypothetical protein
LIGTWVINCFNRESAAVGGKMPHNSQNVTSAGVQNNRVEWVKHFQDGRKEIIDSEKISYLMT